MSPMSQQEYATVNRWHDNVNGPDQFRTAPMKDGIRYNSRGEPIMTIERRTIIGARVDRVALVRIPIAADSEHDIDTSWEFVGWEDEASADRLRAAAQTFLDIESEPAYSWVAESARARAEGTPNRAVEQLERLSAARNALRAAIARAYAAQPEDASEDAK